MCSLETENSGFDAGKFYDEGVEEAGLDPEEVVTDSPADDDSTNVASQDTEKAVEEPEQKPAAETKPDEKPSTEDVKAAIESTEDTEQEVDSVISALLPPESQAPEAAKHRPDYEPGKFVPVEDHIKLRARAQAAEGKVSELEQQIETSTTQTGGVKPGEEVEKSPFEVFVDENPDEDFVPPKVQLEERKFQEAKKQKAQAAKEKVEQAEREKQEKQYRTTEAIRTISTRALKSEVEVRKATPDFDAVVKPFVAGNLLTDAERVEFLKDANPAQKLYDICKAKAEAFRSALGIKTAPKTETTKKAPTTEEVPAGEEDELTDQQIFDEVKDIFHPDEEES